LKTLALTLVAALMACDGASGKLVIADDSGEPATGPTEDTEPPPPDACDDSPDQLLCDARVAITCDAAGDIASTEDCDQLGDSSGVCLPDLGCASCQVTLTVGASEAAGVTGAVTDTAADTAADTGTGEAPVATVSLPRVVAPTGEDWGWTRYGLRPVVVAADPTLPGLIELSAEGGIGVYDESGERLTAPARLLPGDLPVTLMVAGLETGEGTLGATYLPSDEDDPDQACGAQDPSLTFTVAPLAGLAGHALDGFPWFQVVETFNAGGPVAITLDPAWFTDRADQPFDLYAVPHRGPEDWAADPSLDAPLAAGVTLDGGALTIWDEAPEPADPLGDGWDIILDYDQDGALSSGDLFDGPGLGDGEAGLFVVGDLGEDGPFSVGRDTYNGGVWRRQTLYWPEDTAAAAPIPLVVISHGNGHDYTWYDWIGDHLASHGYAVMSHSNDTGPGIDTASETTLTNTDYFLEILDGVAGGALAADLDPSRITWIGHSRGGEGVARAYDKIVTGEYTPTYYTGDQIALISSIAPTVFEGAVASNPHDTPYHLIAGAGDGDVNGAPDCEQCQFFRIARVATGPAQVTYLQGVGHNEFNCCGFDDATGPDQIGRAATQELARRYYTALLGAYIRDRSHLLEYFSRMSDDLKPLGVSDGVILANQYQTDRALADGVLDSFQSESSISVGSAGGDVAIDAGSPDEDRLEDDDDRLAWRDSDPMNGMTQAEDSDDQDRGLVFDFTAGEAAAVELSVPAERQDVSSYTWLSMRLCQGTRHPETVALDGPLTFSVTLVDADGEAATIPTAHYGGITQPYQRSGEGPGEGWSNEFSTVRLRLSDFRADGAGPDLTRLAAVRLEFGEESGSDRGRVGIDDLEFLQ